MVYHIEKDNCQFPTSRARAELGREHRRSARANSTNGKRRVYVSFRTEDWYSWEVGSDPYIPHGYVAHHWGFHEPIVLFWTVYIRASSIPYQPLILWKRPTTQLLFRCSWWRAENACPRRGPLCGAYEHFPFHDILPQFGHHHLIVGGVVWEAPYPLFRGRIPVVSRNGPISGVLRPGRLLVRHFHPCDVVHLSPMPTVSA